MTSEKSPRPSGNGQGQHQSGGTSDDNRPRIQVNNRELPRVTADAISAMVRAASDTPTVFVHGSGLVRARLDSIPPHLEAMTKDRLRNYLARIAKWITVKEVNGKLKVTLAKVPDDLLANVLAEPGWPLPEVVRIVTVPVFAPGGSLETEPGYHEQSRVLYWPSAELSVPTVPNHASPAVINAARGRLVDDLLVDFPFVSNADRAHAVAALLLPFVRAMISGPTPLHLVGAPTRGTGKTLLAWSVAYPAAGDDLGVQTEARYDDEWRKRIGAALTGGPSVVLFDNLKGFLGSGALAAVLTSTMWVDRRLGKNDESIRVPNQALWIATSNNPTIADEMVRRIVPIQLDAGEEKPFERDMSRFKHPDQRRWLPARRGIVVWSALTLAQAWIDAGKPNGQVTIGSFEDWSQVMGGILDVAGIPGFLANIDEFRNEFDTETAGWVAFFAAWYEAHGRRPVRTSEIIGLYDHLDDDFLNIDTRYQTSRGRVTTLGKRLAKRRGDIYGGLKLEYVGKQHGGAQHRLLPIDDRRG